MFWRKYDKFTDERAGGNEKILTIGMMIGQKINYRGENKTGDEERKKESEG